MTNYWMKRRNNKLEYYKAVTPKKDAFCPDTVRYPDGFLGVFASLNWAKIKWDLAFTL
jgi:hypothetical protein